MKEDLNRYFPQKINEFSSLALAGRYPLVIVKMTFQLGRFDSSYKKLWKLKAFKDKGY